MIRCLKFRIKVVEGSFYLCSENQGADQLWGYRTADLPLCFRICKKPVEDVLKPPGSLLATDRSKAVVLV